MSHVLRKSPHLEALLDPQVFTKVHVAEWGHSIEWFDAELGPDNVYASAKEQAGLVSHEMFDGWMYRSGLSLSTAAEALGILRSMPLCSAAAACRLQKSEIHFVRGAFR